VTAVALTYKLGVHAASGILKPLLVDHGWDRAAIGHAVVTFGAAASVLGSLLGAQMHRAWGERAAMISAAWLQCAAVLALLAVERAHAPRALSTALIALEHLASGAGTTALFAGLMTATRRDRAALHYTALTSLNVVAIFAGSILGAALADLFGVSATFVVSAALCLAPLPLLRRWDQHAAQSAGLEDARATP
jgi:predicted MFS family arabinose efflux permease